MLNYGVILIYRSKLMSRQIETSSCASNTFATPDQNEHPSQRRNGRHFYASHVNSNGKELVFGFDKVEDRNSWMQKRNDSKILKANDVYKILNRKKDEVVIASTTRRLRVIKVDKLDDEMRQHVVMS